MATDLMIVVVGATGPVGREVREELAAAPGLRIVDDRAGNGFPTSLKASGEDGLLAPLPASNMY